jgi:formate dehydrogenase major subunit
MVKLWVNDREVKANFDETILQACKREGIEIPSLCDLPSGPKANNPCGLCVVEIEGKGIVRACETLVEEGLRVKTDTPQVKEIRRTILNEILANHYGDCKSPCHTPCPGKLNIQGYIGFIAKGDFKASLALIKEKLPLPACVGRVCPRFCEPICRRTLVDSPVAINNLKRFVADYCYEHGEIPPEIKPSKGKKVAVIGAGPAGLSCAYFLRLDGYDVVIFDRDEQAGGMLRYGIPSFKLPKYVVDREVSSILNLGIEFRPKMTWGRDFTLKDLFAEDFKAVFIAIGARKEKLSGFPGEELAESGLGFLFRFNKGEINSVDAFKGKKVAILGCSYTAVDLSRVLIRLSARIDVIYQRSRIESAVPQREISYAEKEGVHFVFATAPVELIALENGYELKLARTIKTEKREVKILEDTIFTEKYDFVFRAWGEDSVTDFLSFGEIESKLEVTPEGILKVDTQTLATSIPGVFVGGDVRTGTRTVIQAVAEGRKTAQAIKAYLEDEQNEHRKQSYLPKITVKFDFSRGKRVEEIDSNFLNQFTPQQRARLKERPIEERIKDFKEVLIGLTPEEAQLEAQRCLKCGCLGIHKCDLRKYMIIEDVPATNSLKRIKYPIKMNHPQIEVDLNKCIACEKCVRICPYSAIFFKVVDKGKPTEYITFRFTESCVNCGKCVDTCPTGALVKKNQPVPYEKGSAKEVKSVCGYCGVGCNLTVVVKNSTILEVKGRDLPPNYGFTCVKGVFGFEYYRSHERLTKPLIRKNIKEEFKEVDWETALEFVAENLLRIKDKYGPSALGFLCSSRTSNEENYLLQKIARGIFNTNNIDNSARVCHAPSVAGLAATVGTGAACTNFDEIENAEVIFILGNNTTEAHPVVAQKIEKALNKGTKLIVADPRRIPLADKANIFLQLKPGSNVPLLNGMAHVIIREELYNKEFVDKYVKNFESFRHYILSNWELVKVQRYTGIPAFQIEQAAYLYARAKSALILWGLGLVEHRAGSYAVMATANLAILCGFWGKPGCGAVPLRGHNNVQGACDMGGLPYVLPGYQNYLEPEVRQKFEEVWGLQIPATEGLMLSKMLESALLGSFKGLYLMGYDVAMSHSVIGKVFKAFESLEFLVCQDIFPPLSAKWAHAVLPSACVFEKCGTFTNGERRVQLFEKAVEPPGLALPDWFILTKLAQKLGCHWNYESPADIAKEIGLVWNAWKGINYQRLKLSGIQWPCPDEDHPGTSILFTNGFPKSKIYLAIPKHIEPLETPTPDKPFILVTVIRLEHHKTGSMTRRAPSLTRLYSEPTVDVNPEDAKAYGLCAECFVKVKNERGEVIYKVKINPRVPKGYIYTDAHFDSALTNILISEGLDELTDTPEYKVTAVSLEKV